MRLSSRLVAGLVDALPFGPSVLVLGTIFGASSGPSGIQPLSAVRATAGGPLALATARRSRTP